MLNAAFAAALIFLTVDEHCSVKVDDRTEVMLTLRSDSVRIDWTCAEDNMEYVNSFYGKPRWDVWNGEAVECSFSPYGREGSNAMGNPDYRLLSNPSNNFFSAFRGERILFSPFTSKTVRREKNWSVSWCIPFSALETFGGSDVSDEKASLPGNIWTFKFSRRTETGGKKSSVSSPVMVLKIPEKVMAPYRRIVLAGCRSAEAGEAGNVVISCELHNTAKDDFTGKAELRLLAGEEISILKEIELQIPSGESVRFDQTVSLPKKAVKFRIQAVIEDSNGLPIRISRDLPIENPWVVF